MKIIILGLIIFSIGCFAENEKNEFSINKQYEKSLEVFDEIVLDNSSSSWIFSRFRVRLRSKIALEVPYLSKLEMRPFIEFHFSE
jgi:hypothetical protein